MGLSGSLCLEHRKRRGFAYDGGWVGGCNICRGYVCTIKESHGPYNAYSASWALQNLHFEIDVREETCWPYHIIRDAVPVGRRTLLTHGVGRPRNETAHKSSAPEDIRC
ncbi:hypothetical protein TgHK011_004750 [Trichoderma gracile]|nr:hypothetical protein TgHK011_004750 [Trichoderma gracile]